MEIEKYLFYKELYWYVHLGLLLQWSKLIDI